tara:strand:- start:174 stop:389 length:216 start_codon:yes stop_codon:yes gene_type:complete
MELVFALITYLGMQKVDTSYFRNINDCRYFAARINENQRVPELKDDKIVPGRKYIAVCQPVKVDPKRERVF